MLDFYKVGEASCEIETFNEKGFDMNSSVKWVKNLQVPIEHRRKGLASQLLKQLGKEADATQIALILECRPFDDSEIDADSLEALYKRHGFIKIQDEPKLMTRIPVPPMLFEQIKQKPTSKIIQNLYS
jgi:hypothetical protein